MKKFLWVDILCWESMARTVRLCRQIPVEKVCYLNRARGVSDKQVRLFEKRLGRPVECVDGISAGEHKIADCTLFELIYYELANVLNKIVESMGVKQRIHSFSQKNNFNALKFREHLREAAVSHVFKPIEMKFFAKKVSGEEKSLFLIRRTCFAEVFAEMLGGDNTHFYSTGLTHLIRIDNRPQFRWDPLRNKEYLFDRGKFFMQVALYWTAMGVNFLMGAFMKKKNTTGGVNIGVEFLQPKVRFDRINDIYWLPGSGIDPATICSIEYEDFDEESSRNIDSLSIQRYRYCRNPFKILRSLRAAPGKLPYQFLAPTFFDWVKFLLYPWRMLFSRGSWDLLGWVRYQEINYLLRVKFWESVYRQLGIKMLWTMFDYDPDKLTKAQALENVDGLYLGSHWTNYQMAAIANDQKAYDVFFPWGEHFVKNIHNNYPFLAVFPVGYPLDFYFEKRRAAAMKLRHRYPGKFIISFHDNVCSHDFTYGWPMQIDLHRMLISLLEKYDQLVIFLKPKRLDDYERVRQEIPEIEQGLQEGRIAAFLGETVRTRAVAAEIGMASDLVIGLGISTPATECFFAGTMSFHADFPGFARNEYSREGRNKFVFWDQESLRQAIEARIEGRDQATCEDYKKYHWPLDPFQDGKAYLRTGAVIRQLQTAFEQGLSREEAVKKLRADWGEYQNLYHKELVH